MTKNHPDRHRGGRIYKNYQKDRSCGRESSNHQLPQKITDKSIFKGNCTELEIFIIDCSNYKKANKYVLMTNFIAEYLGADYKQGGDI